MAMADEVRYRVGGDNLLLRSVLHRHWKYRCYWCGWLKDFNDIDIDHIVPQTAAGERLQWWKTQFGLPDEFDIHDPGNLAPACGNCNGPSNKGGEDWSDLPVVANKLQKARDLRSKVIRDVQDFAKPSKTAEALIRANDADLSNPGARQMFETYAPAVVQKLALLDEDKADFTSAKTVAVEVDATHRDPELEVGIFLRARERKAAAILEDVCGGMIEDVVQEPVIDLFQQIHERVQHDFENVRSNSEELDYPIEPITAGPPVSTFMRINVDSLDFYRAGPSFEFKFGGEFEASLSASLAQYSSDGSELLELQGDAFVKGRYSFVATWDISEGGDIDADDCFIESWDCDKNTHRWT
jgi:hypothetical protein